MERRDYTLVRSDRRTLAIEVNGTGGVTVRAPRRCSQRDIDRFLASRAQWIASAQARQAGRAAAHPEPDAAERERLIALARELLPPLVERWSAVTGLRPAALTITGARTRFGSCSTRNRLSFSWRLMAYPAEAVEYVVVHELCHIAHHDHSPAFHDLVRKYLPDSESRRELLRK